MNDFLKQGSISPIPYHTGMRNQLCLLYPELVASTFGSSSMFASFFVLLSTCFFRVLLISSLSFCLKARMLLKIESWYHHVRSVYLCYCCWVNLPNHQQDQSCLPICWIQVTLTMMEKKCLFFQVKQTRHQLFQLSTKLCAKQLYHMFQYQTFFHGTMVRNLFEACSIRSSLVPHSSLSLHH